MQLLKENAKRRGTEQEKVYLRGATLVFSKFLTIRDFLEKF